MSVSEADGIVTSDLSKFTTFHNKVPKVLVGTNDCSLLNRLYSPMLLA